ncbi:polyprenyl synthetase family protein [Leucobacter sp. W1478]|uniref:polyprenyl synthetase family protein n=1 Tax=Leucobacter sp. W1478 TaxID=3439065 RepID=UPI003F3F5D73
MDETTRLAGLVQERISDVISEHRTELEALGSDSAPVLDEAQAYLSGGKRLRAQFATLGYRAVGPLDFSGTPDPKVDQILDVACALEFFHAAALIHDDVIDRSDTRRGRPAVHRHFASIHQSNQWRGSSEHFGLSSAILLGDLLQSWADERLQRACDAAPERGCAAAARGHFNRMRSEVAIGQYLDVLEEQIPTFSPEQEQLERSTRVLVYKSAKYSVEAPLLIGAALAGASAEQEQALADFGLPVGVAFQLRDDLLGVFGDQEVTGKPAGDDLAEGKRTILVTIARSALPATQQRVFDELIGDPQLDAEQIEMLQRTIRGTGAVEQVEQMITRNLDRATGALASSPLRPEARRQLSVLAERVSKRDF